MTTAIARQLLTQARVSVPLDDGELCDLAASVGLRIGQSIPLPHGVGAILYHGAFHPRRDISRLLWRTMLVYAVARHYLYADSCLCLLGRPPRGDPVGEEWQRLRRSALLAGALALGDNFEPAQTVEDIADIAALAEFPREAVLAYQNILETAEAQRELWRFPALGRELRRLSGRV